MARIDTPTHSDDEFDLLYDAESVSEISDVHEDTDYSAPNPSSKRAHSAGPERLSGPHEVPVLPYSTGEDGGAAASEKISGHSTRDDHASSSSTVQRGPETNTKGRGFMNEGLQYTKSVYSKLWNKDALIAVMGYVRPR